MRRRTFVKSALVAAAAAIPAGRILADSSAATLKAVTDINAVTLNGGSRVVERAVVRELAAGLRGRLLLPSSDGYDTARRGWNGMIDKRPALIAQCQGAADVTLAVNLAREYQLLTAVRGGAHSANGKFVCEGGIVIDLSPMQGVRVDPVARSARVEPGVLLGALDRESQAFGLAVPAGVVSDTGAAGLTLGGGFGKLSRSYGLTIDNLRYVDMITASGEFRRASVSENPDLFWGLRGGGGNFGVVTSFEYQLHPVGTTFLAGGAMHPLTAARDVITFVTGFQETAPKETQVSITALCLPNGKGFVSVSFFYSGDMAKGEKVMQPLLAFGKPMNAHMGPESYVEIQRSTDRNVPRGAHYYQKAGFLKRVDTGLIDAVVNILANPKPVPTNIGLTQLGGAISQIDTGATAYANRDAVAQVVLGGSWPGPTADADRYMEAYRKDWATLYPFTDGFYINNMMGDEADRDIRANFGVNYDRLVTLKNKYDPMNLFRLNANVLPATGS